MFLRNASSFGRMAAYFAFTSILAAGVAPTLPAQVQMKSGSSFSSSVDAADTPTVSTGESSSLVATNTEDAVLPAAPSMTAAPVAGAGGQSDASYGYGGGHHFNASHLAFEVGGGANAPIGNDAPFITWGGNVTVGGGLRLQKHISVLAEYQFIDDKLPGGLISDAGAQGGHAHIWSLTLDPVIDLFPSRRNDLYVTGGGGFYRKVTSFTDPEEVEECYYFCVTGTENVVVSHFSSNQGGLNAGFGITHRLSSDGNLKVFAEARYIWINTPAIGETDGLGTTGLVPATFGVRW